MDWLTFIDSKYNQIIVNKSSKTQFIYHLDHNLPSVTENVNFVIIKKHKKTKILFEDIHGRKLYLTDVDIINILIKAEQEIFDLIKMWLIEYEQNKFDNEIVLEIEGQSFNLPLSFPKNHCDTKENLHILMKSKFKSNADFYICYYDLMILISLIVDKEKITGEKMINNDERKSRQLKKYIILSDFYRSGKYINDLKENEYSVEKQIDDVYFNSSIAKKIDLIFNKISFQF